jgi:enamine deaminase RidA (YjgF/YER057c/UK114 family)
MPGEIPVTARTSPAERPTARGAEVLHPKNWPVPRGYSNGMMAEGKFVVTGGIIGWDENGNFPEGFVAQARQTFENICQILAEAGAGPQHIVRLTWYVVDIDDYLANLRELGRAYREVLGANYPAMALVQVVRLVEKKALVEIEATAVLPVKS